MKFSKEETDRTNRPYGYITDSITELSHTVTITPHLSEPLSASHVQRRAVSQVLYIIHTGRHLVQASYKTGICVRRVPEWRSELIVAQQLLAGLDEDPLHGAPPVVLVGSAHAVHLALAADGVAVLLARHAQKDVRAHVLEAHCLVALPVVAVALHRPQVQVVALAVLSESADLLQLTQTGAGKERHLYRGDNTGQQLDLRGVKSTLCCPPSSNDSSSLTSAVCVSKPHISSSTKPLSSKNTHTSTTASVWPGYWTGASWSGVCGGFGQSSCAWCGWPDRTWWPTRVGTDGWASLESANNCWHHLRSQLQLQTAVHCLHTHKQTQSLVCGRMHYNRIKNAGPSFYKLPNWKTELLRRQKWISAGRRGISRKVLSVYMCPQLQTSLSCKTFSSEVWRLTSVQIAVSSFCPYEEFLCKDIVKFITDITVSEFEVCLGNLDTWFRWLW